MKKDSLRPVLLCACLAAGLMLDPMGFLRMTLLCAAVHETGHVLVYILCARRLPRLELEMGGVSLNGAQGLSKGQELAVLAAGPMANFLMASLLLWRVWHRASYRLYFLAAVSLCTGIYNLLPFGVLDGARILQNLLPASGQDLFLRAQRALLCVFCAALLLLAAAGVLPDGARLAALTGPACLLAREFFIDKNL